MRKGHILILVENLPVPFDRRVWMESLALTEAGYKVSVISPCPPEELGTPDRVIDGVHVDALPLHYDRDAWLAEFAAQWPAGSDAEVSYGARIRNGPRYGLNRAMGQGIRIHAALLRQLHAANTK